MLVRRVCHYLRLVQLPQIPIKTQEWIREQRWQKKTFFKLAKEIHRKTYTINCKWRDLEYSSRNLTFMEKDIKPGWTWLSRSVGPSGWWTKKESSILSCLGPKKQAKQPISGHGWENQIIGCNSIEISTVSLWNFTDWSIYDPTTVLFLPKNLFSRDEDEDKIFFCIWSALKSWWWMTCQ